jgi:hypothetical protein
MRNKIKKIGLLLFSVICLVNTPVGKVCGSNYCSNDGDNGGTPLDNPFYHNFGDTGSSNNNDNNNNNWWQQWLLGDNSLLNGGSFGIDGIAQPNTSFDQLNDYLKALSPTGTSSPTNSGSTGSTGNPTPDGGYSNDEIYALWIDVVDVVRGAKWQENSGQAYIYGDGKLFIPVMSDDTKKQVTINYMVSYLNNKLKIYCPTCPPLPMALYTKRKADELGAAFAAFKYQSVSPLKIFVYDQFFTLASDDDRLSTLYHEYTHSKMMLPIVRNPDGSIPVINTGQPKKYTKEEWDYYHERCAAENYSGLAYETEQCTRNYFIREYKYTCSNYFRDEIAARQAELNGEMMGFYTLTEAYRKERIANIKELTWDLGRAINYEDENKLNPDGSHK